MVTWNGNAISHRSAEHWAELHHNVLSLPSLPTDRPV
jgi:hypothetical protein